VTGMETKDHFKCTVPSTTALGEWVPQTWVAISTRSNGSHTSLWNKREVS